MPRVIASENYILSFDAQYREFYWRELSNYARLKYGNGPFIESENVLIILKDCFGFLLNQFQKLCANEIEFTFWKYVFWLHEESIMLYQKTLKGVKLEEIEDNQFAMYRRVLKAILEQGCDIDMNWGSDIEKEVIERYDDVIQRLYYIGTWMYSFAEMIAYQNMVDNCHYIKFATDNTLIIDWQFHYGQVYHQFLPRFLDDYGKGIIDKESVADLKKAIEKAFKIDYDFAGGVIFEIKKYHNLEEWELQTIEPSVLPLNLANHCNIDIDTAKTFYDGLTLSRNNKLPLDQLVCKPYSLKRYMYRPILIYKINGEERALVGWEKFTESIVTLCTNAVQWNQLSEEWLTNPEMQRYINKKGAEHDKLLEDKIEEILLSQKIEYCRNIKSFRRRTGNQININNSVAGEIDFIIINKARKTVLIADAKYNRSKYEAVGYRIDYSNFIKEYEPKMSKKVSWAKNNLAIIREHMEVIGKLKDDDIDNYKVEGIFLINTPTFYMFNGEYKAYSIQKFREYIHGEFEFPTLTFEFKNFYVHVNHPYFKKQPAQNFLHK